MHSKLPNIQVCDKYFISEKNYFDQQQQQQAEVAEEAEEETEIPTVPADPLTTDERCYVCRLVSPLLSCSSLNYFFNYRDTFEQFFNEDKEEWHLRNAIRVDENTYHPVCYEDHQVRICTFILGRIIFNE